MLRPGVDAFASRTLSIQHPFSGSSRSAPDWAADHSGARVEDVRVDPVGWGGEVAAVGGPRLLAAHLLERNLLRLGRAGALVERRLAPGLQRLASRRLYRLLGYVRLGDYLTERLGMSLRRCQAILRLERVVESLPRLGLALKAGEVSLSKVETVAGVATDVTEMFWLERARRLTVADLRETVGTAQAGGDPVGEPVAPAGRPVAQAPETMEQDEPGRLLSFSAPAPVFALWHWTLDLVRRVAGRQEPAWRCAEYLAAEFLSGVPEAPRDEARAAATHGAEGPSGDGAPGPLAPGAPGRLESEAQAPDAPTPGAPAPEAPPPDAFAAPDNGTPQSAAGAVIATSAVAGLNGSEQDPARADSDRSGMAAWSEACEAVREALASIGAAADVEAILSEPAPPGGDDEPDAWELDALLRRLVRLRQSLAWRQGRLLAAFAALRLHRDLGFGSLDDWIGDRLPMSPRRARYLISLDRRLRGLPLVADAYRRGLLSWCQARLLVRVVLPGVQSRWIRYARRVTVRRLEEAVIACEVETAEPAHIGAPPLPPVDPSPDEVVRAPADPAALHTSALDRPGGLPGIGSLHTSAPLSGGGAAGAVSTGRRAWRRIVFWAPLDVAALWDSALRSCRGAAGPQLEDWECFLLFVRALRDTWENPDDPQWKRRYRIFERDGWRCMAPGCTSRSGLNEHHIVFRSQQGNDEDENLVALCVGHHQEGIHASRLRCFGRAPDSLWWDLGIRPGGEPLMRYFGERVVTRRPHVPLPERVTVGAA
jgi:hypothetical protein